MSKRLATIGAAVDRTDGGIRVVGGIGAERSEIVSADECGGGLAHGGQVELPSDVPGLRAQEGVHRGVIPDEIAILLARGIEPGMERGAGAGDGQNSDILREPGVDREQQLGGFEERSGFRPGDLKVRHHAQRVDSGVRPAGTMHLWPAGKQLGQGPFDQRLNPRADLLDLPAFVARPIVGDG